MICDSLPPDQRLMHAAIAIARMLAMTRMPGKMTNMRLRQVANGLVALAATL